MRHPSFTTNSTNELFGEQDDPCQEERENVSILSFSIMSNFASQLGEPLLWLDGTFKD
jgi:hypothetical protein